MRRCATICADSATVNPYGRCGRRCGFRAVNRRCHRGHAPYRSSACRAAHHRQHGANYCDAADRSQAVYPAGSNGDVYYDPPRRRGWFGVAALFALLILGIGAFVLV